MNTRNAAGLTHVEHIAAHPTPTPCTCYHITFGGHCLNCGWRPEYDRPAPKTNEDYYRTQEAKS